MILPRAGLALLGAISVFACAAPRQAPSPAPIAAPSPLVLHSLLEIAPGAGLDWVVQAKPRELLADKAMVAALETIVPRTRLDQFATRYGGIDPTQASEILVASYPDATFAAARLPIDPARVEAAFAARALAVEGRAVERGVTRLWGSVDGEREQVAIFGSEAVALEHGRLGPLRAAVYFAEGRLRRAQPAIRTEPLAPVAARLGDAPLLGFVPGPFEGAWGAGLGGLLRATTAAAGAAQLTRESAGLALHLRIVLAGSWGDDAAAAGDRFAAAFQVFAQDPLGHLMALDHPLDGPRVSTDPTALELDVTLDPVALVRGLHAATGASLHEILGLSAAH